VRRLNRAYDAKFNAPWGQLFKAGLHDSRFGKQVRCASSLFIPLRFATVVRWNSFSDYGTCSPLIALLFDCSCTVMYCSSLVQVQSYACLYTSRVSNLQYVYPRR
jgi:hypothetical protein